LLDSICMHCFLTVASASHEDQLDEHENTHQCSPIRLFAIANGALPEAPSRQNS
jgi:hypothetical protein